MASRQPRIAVVGSLNIDLIASVDRLPRAGETLAAAKLIRRFGGKGANQALAAARQGARVSMIGCVGGDADGESYRAHLVAAGIDCGGITAVQREVTGTALISVDAAGENHIVVAAGANGAVRPQLVRENRSAIEAAGALLLQLEVPLPAVIEAMRIASRARVPIVFTAAPWRADFPWAKSTLDVVVVNEEEARAMFGQVVRDAAPRRAALVRPILERLRIASVVITRGARPTLCFSAGESFEVPTLSVKPVDTVGAGDAFSGALATALASGEALREAVRWANCAGALATLRPGAQEALPSAAQVRGAMRRL